MFHICFTYGLHTAHICFHLRCTYASHTFHQRKCVCFIWVLHMFCMRGHLGYVIRTPSSAPIDGSPGGFWDSAKEFSSWQTDFSEFLWFSKDVTSVKIPVDRPQPFRFGLNSKFYMRGWVVTVQWGDASVWALPQPPCHSVWAVLDADMAPKASCGSPGHHGFQDLSHGLDTIKEFGGTPMDWKAPSYNAVTSPKHSALQVFSIHCYTSSRSWVWQILCCTGFFLNLDTSFQSLIPKRGVTNFKWDRDILRPEMWAASTCPSCQAHRQ